MTPRQAALAALTLLCLGGTQPVAAEESGWACPPEGCSSGRSATIRCESQDDRRKYCSVSNIDPESVTMQRKLSHTNCYRGQNWDADSRGVWVDNGCRAVFEYVTRGGGGNSSSNRPGRYGTIKCESEDDRRRHCQVSNIDPGSVTMDRKLSHANCYRGQNWDADSDGIWVDNGCRAVFAFTTRGGGHSGGGGASESSMRQACINRASRDWAVTTSNLEITHSERMQNGGYLFNVQSKRSSGTCMVDRSGNVYRLNTH